MKVKEIMTKDVACVQPDDTIEQAAKIMKQHGCGSIPVCWGNKLEGVVTDRDIAMRCVADGKDGKQQKVKEIMTGAPATGQPEMDVNEAARLMSERQIRRLPILENDSLVGYLALGDISVEPASQSSAGEALSGISRQTNIQM